MSSGKDKSDGSITGQEIHELKALLSSEEEAEGNWHGTLGEAQTPCTEKNLSTNRDTDTPTMAEQTDMNQQYKDVPTVRIVRPRQAGRKNISRENGVEEEHIASVGGDGMLQVNETENDCPNNPNDEAPSVAHRTDTNGEFSASGQMAQLIGDVHVKLVKEDGRTEGQAGPITGTYKIYPAAAPTASDGVRHEKPMVLLSLPADGRSTDSSFAYGEDNESDALDNDDDEPNFYYSDPAEIEVVFEPTQWEQDHARSSTNQQKRFKDLLFHIYYHNVVEMERILDNESERNRALLLIKKDYSDGLPCLLKAVKRQSVKCINSLLERFQELSRTFEEYHIERLEALRSTDRRNIFHIGAETARDGDILNAVDSCHLSQEIADQGDCNETTPLIVACQHQNHEMVVLLVSKYRARIDHIDNNSNSPMYFASSSENENTLEFLVESAAKIGMSLFQLCSNSGLRGKILQPIVDGRNPGTVSMCFTPGSVRQQLILKCLEKELQGNQRFIHQICKTPLADLVKAAGDYQPSLLAFQDENGVTPLMRATEASQFDVVKTILSYESGRETVSLARRSDNQTALLIACENGYAKIAQLIVETCTVDLGHQVNNKRNVFHHASKHSKVLEVLVDVFSRREAYSGFRKFLETPNINGYFPIHCAAVTGSHKSVNFLLEIGVSYNSASISSGKVALHYAACANLKTVKALVEFVKRNGSEDEKKNFIDASDSLSQTSLYIAAYLGKWRTVSYLLENGASMKCNHENGNPLHMAAASGSMKTVKVLVEKHPEFINAENCVGETAAMFAAVSGHTEILKLLLQHKAQLWGKERGNGRNCLDWAVENKQHETAMAILEHPQWRKAMENSFHGADGLLAVMVKRSPNAAMNVLDKCSTTVGREQQKYDFFALQTIEEKPSCGKGRKIVKSLKAVEAMAELPRDECLRHEVVQKFLETKWRNFAKKWYLSFLGVHMIFLLSLNTYSYYVRTGSYSSNHPRVMLATVICYTFAIVNIIIQLVQVLMKKLKYFVHLTSYLEVWMYICLFIFLPKDKKSNRQWQAGAIAIFLGWMNFIWFLRRLPIVGTYIIMVKTILVTFLKAFLSVVMLFIMAFTMTFFVLLHDDKDAGFKNIVESSVTTFAMTLDEFNFRESVRQMNGTNFVLNMFLVIFLILMTILVMNLLTGLAVGDTSKILGRTINEKYAQRAFFIIEMDKYLNWFPYTGAEFVKPITEQQKHDTLTEKLLPSLEEEDPEGPECHCAGNKALLEHILKELKGRRDTLQSGSALALGQQSDTGEYNEQLVGDPL